MSAKLPETRRTQRAKRRFEDAVNRQRAVNIALEELKRQDAQRVCSCRLNPLAGLPVPCDTCQERLALAVVEALLEGWI